MKNTIPQKKFIVLGLLGEHPSHGYELEQKIKDRGIRNWTSIGFSSIYHILKKLEHSGLIQSEQLIVNGKAQHRYTLTADGSLELSRFTELGLTETRGNRGDFSVAISNTIGWPGDRIRPLLQQRIDRLEQDLSGLQHVREEKLAAGMPDIPGCTILFDKPLAQIEAEIKFFKSYIRKF